MSVINGYINSMLCRGKSEHVGLSLCRLPERHRGPLEQTNRWANGFLGIGGKVDHMEGFLEEHRT